MLLDILLKQLGVYMKKFSEMTTKELIREIDDDRLARELNIRFALNDSLVSEKVSKLEDQVMELKVKLGE